MKRPIKSLIILLFVLAFLTGCTTEANSTDVDLFKYKGSYVGDNSAVVNTIIHLQGSKHFSGLALRTKEEPYGVIIDYDWLEAEGDVQRTAIHNASYLFALIHNMDWVILNFETVDGLEEFKITREELEDWYGLNLSEIENEDKLKELIQAHSDNTEEISQLLK